MSRLLAIDPGTTESAYVLIDLESEKLLEFGKVNNYVMRDTLREQLGSLDFVIEEIKSYGNVMGDSILQTCVWIGRFIEIWADKGRVTDLLPRKTIVSELCLRSSATDTNVRRYVMDYYTDKLRNSPTTSVALLKTKEPSIGTKKTPGPLYGVTKDVWQALGVALAWKAIQRRELDFMA